MPNFVAIEINDNKLLVACAKNAAQRCQFNQLFEIPFEDGATGPEIGEKLQSALSERGVSRAEMVGLVCRQDAEIREVAVPPAPDDELPDLVRFQAKNVFASLNDSWLFDFVPLAHIEGEPLNVLAVAIPPHVRDMFEQISSAAGLKLKRLVFRPFALCDLFSGMLAGEDRRLLMLPVDGRFDAMVTSGSQMVAARSFNINRDAEPQAVARQAVVEIRRTIASSRGALHGGEIQQIIVGGAKEQWSDLESQLKEKLELPIVFFAPMGCIDPAQFTAPEMPQFPERYSATIGALVRESNSSKHGVDFLNPRRPVVKKRDYRKLLVPLAVAAMLFLMAGGYGWYVLNEQAKVIEAKRDELDNERKLNNGTDLIIGEVGVMDEWQAGKVNWMDDLAFISEKLLTPDDVIISKFRGIEKRDGYQIELNSQVSREKSTDSTWQETFSERYAPPVFKDITENPKSKTHPINRPFRLDRSKDVALTIEQVNKVAQQRRMAELDALDEPEPDSDADGETDKTEAEAG